MATLVYLTSVVELADGGYRESVDTLDSEDCAYFCVDYTKQMLIFKGEGEPTVLVPLARVIRIEVT